MPRGNNRGRGRGPETPEERTTRLGALGRDEVQSRMDEINSKGFRGSAIDPTPNENYTVAGVTGGAPTPETDVDLEAEAAAAANVGGGTLAATEEENTATEEAAEENLGDN